MISIINEHQQLLAVMKGFNIKRSMIGEICSRIELDLTDQHGKCEEGIVLRIFICHSSPCLSGVGRMAELQASTTSLRSMTSRLSSKGHRAK